MDDQAKSSRLALIVVIAPIVAIALIVMFVYLTSG
jgi:hypothetical protein